jgi:hypothetical protein
MSSRRARRPMRRTLPPVYPQPVVTDDNPMTVAKVELGRRLFYDKRLSTNRTQSCASCHRQSHALAEDAATSTGSSGERHHPQCDVAHERGLQRDVHLGAQRNHEHRAAHSAAAVRRCARGDGYGGGTSRKSSRGSRPIRAIRGLDSLNCLGNQPFAWSVDTRAAIFRCCARRTAKNTRDRESRKTPRPGRRSCSCTAGSASLRAAGAH